MPDLTVGSQLKAWPACQYEHEDTTILNISSTTPISDDGSAAAINYQFTAPESGRVIIVIAASMRSGGSDSVSVTPFVWEGTSSAGTSIIDDTDFWKHGCGNVAQLGTDYATVGRRSILTGLTAGATHFAELRYWVSGGSSADIRNRDMGVIPTS